MNPPDRPPAAGRPEFHPPEYAPPAGGLRPAPVPVPADPGLRFGARVLDTFIGSMCSIVAGLSVTGVFAAIYGGDMEGAGLEYGVPMMIGLIGAPFLCEWIQVWRWGGSAGKRIVGVQVVRAADGGPLTPGQAALRALCHSPGIYYVPNWLPVLAQLNVLWMIWDRPRRQCLHDKVAKTVVVKTAPAPHHSV